MKKHKTKPRVFWLVESRCGVPYTFNDSECAELFARLLNQKEGFRHSVLKTVVVSQKLTP